jgi:zinc protease
MNNRVKMSMRLKALTLSLCALGMSTAVFAKPVLIKSEHQIEEYQLDNGFRVVLAQNPKENKVYMNTIYFTGSLNDPDGKGGLAHLLEHLAFKGSQNIPGDEFQRRLDQFTLNSNAMTDYRSTRYLNTLRPDAKAINGVLQLEAERMDKLVLQQKHVPTEIDIVKREREVRLDQPFSVLFDSIFKAAYGNRSIGRAPIGDLNELQSINMQELNTFYKDWYMPNNAMMVISGKFDKAQVLKSIDQHFSPLQKRDIPVQATVPVLDGTKIQPRQFHVKKGSNYIAINAYLNQTQQNASPALSLVPTLYGLEPSGLLYKNMVETGQAIAAEGGTWLDADMSMVYTLGVYSPQHDAKKVQQGLISGTEGNKTFSAVEVKRAQNIVNNAAQTIEKNASALGDRLAEYIVDSKGDWTEYFADLDRVQKLTATEVNQYLAQTLKPEYRLQALVEPTPEDQKKAVERQATVQNTENEAAPEEPLKSVGEYKREIKDYVKKSKALLQANEKKIQRGRLSSGAQYAFFNTSTQDDKNYASIQLDFSDSASLKNQAEVLDLMTYLILRGSEQYNLQAIMDKSIEVQGAASVTRQGNSLNIRINAKKEHFADYLNYMLSIIRQPSFTQTEFDLAVQQTLASLDRPYTEPSTVSALTLGRMTEQYEAGDLRYHFEPEFVKKQYSAAKREQILAAYKKFISADHAYVAITGEFDANEMKQTLEQKLADWKIGQNYTRLDSKFVPFKATQKHVLAEQREFGSYMGLLTMPVGIDHEDAVALQVFRHIFADSQLSSRLGLQLREKNALVYGFGGQLILNDWEDVGALSITANYSAGRSAEVSQTVHDVLTEMVNKGITTQELEAAKSDLLKKRVSSLEDERRIHGALIGQLERDRDLLYRSKRDQKIAKLTKHDVDQVMKKYIHLDQLVEVMADQYAKPETVTQ